MSKPQTDYKTSQYCVAYLDILGVKNHICEDIDGKFLNYLNMFFEDAKSEAHALWAVIFSIAKELKDYYTKVIVNKEDAYKIFVDCMRDLKADWYGIQKAKETGCCSEKVKNVEDIFKK